MISRVFGRVVFVLGIALVNLAAVATSLPTPSYSQGTCQIHAVLTLDQNPGPAQNSIYLLSWVQDAASINIAVSSSDPKLPYGLPVWSSSSQMPVGSSLRYRGLLQKDVLVTYVEKGLDQGKDYVKFRIGDDEFTSNDSGRGCELASWAGYTDPGLENYQTRQTWCNFAC